MIAVNIGQNKIYNTKQDRHWTVEDQFYDVVNGGYYSDFSCLEKTWVSMRNKLFSSRTAYKVRSVGHQQFAGGRLRTLKFEKTKKVGLDHIHFLRLRSLAVESSVNIPPMVQWGM